MNILSVVVARSRMKASATAGACLMQVAQIEADGTSVIGREFDVSFVMTTSKCWRLRNSIISPTAAFGSSVPGAKKARVTIGEQSGFSLVDGR